MMKRQRVAVHFAVAISLLLGYGGSAIGDKGPQKGARMAGASATPASAPGGKAIVHMPPAVQRWVKAGRPKVRMVDGWYPARRADVTRNNVVDQFVAKDKALRQQLAATPGSALVWDTIMIGAGLAAEEGAASGWDINPKSVLLISNEAELRRGNVSNTTSRNNNGRVLYPKTMLSLDALDPDVLLEPAAPTVVETKRPVGDPMRFRVTLANGTTVYARWVKQTDNRGYAELPPSISKQAPADVQYKFQTWPPIYSEATK